MIEWRDLRAEVFKTLDAAGVVHADSEARFMVEEASGADPSEWLEVAMQVAPAKATARLRDMCDRRVRGEPLQYVLGAWSFRGLDVMVDDRVLIPRPETEWVVEVALEEAQRAGLRRVTRRPALGDATRAYVADLGTGSGAIALAVEAALPEVEVWATDVSDEALAVASANVAGCAATRVRIASGSWFVALPAALRGRFTLIVANPPYVAAHEVADLPHEVAEHEPLGALVSGPTGLEALELLIREAPMWLAPRASALVCEIAPHQADAVVALAQRAGFRAPAVRNDLASRPRVLVARRD